MPNLFVATNIILWCVIVPLFGAMLLRAACALNNRIFGRFTKKTVEPTLNSDVPLASEVDPSFSASLDRPYASPSVPLGPAKVRVPIEGRLVAAPGFGKSFAICLATSIVVMVSNGGAQYVLGANPAAGLVITLLSLLIVLLFLAAILARFLPTSYRNATSVTGLCFTIAIAMLIFVVATAGIFIYLLTPER
jgi:hypothetical protein